MIDVFRKKIARLPFVKTIFFVILVLVAVYFANQVVEERINLWLYGVMGVIILYLIVMNPRTGFLIMIAFLPLTAYPKFDLGFFIKLSYIMALVLFLVFAAQAALKKDLKIYRSPLDASLFFLFLVTALSIFQSRFIGEPQYVIRGSWFNQPYNRSIFQFLALLSMMIPYYLTLSYIDSEKMVKKVIKVWTYAAFLVSLFGIYGFIGHYLHLPFAEYAVIIEFGRGNIARIQSTCEEPIFLGFFLMTIIPVLFAILLSKRKEFYFKYMLPMIITMMVCFVLTFSRSAWISFIPAFLFIVYQYRFVISRNAVKFVLAIGIFIIFLAVMDMTVFRGALYNYAVVRSTGVLAGEEFSSLTRWEADYVAFRLFQVHPVLGVGIGNFNFHFMDYVPAWHYLLYPGTDEFFFPPNVGNLFIGFLAEMGILGFIALIWFFIAIFKSSFKTLKASWDSRWNPLLVGGIASIIALIVNYQFISTLTFCYVWILFGFIIAVQKLAVKKEDAI